MSIAENVDQVSRLNATFHLPKAILGRRVGWVQTGGIGPRENSGRVCEPNIYPKAREENPRLKANK